MRDFMRIVAVSLLLVLVVIVDGHLTDVVEYARIDGLKQDTIIMELRKNSRNDSLYWDHLGTCSLISRDQVVITPDNYVKVIPATGYAGRFDITMK